MHQKAPSCPFLNSSILTTGTAVVQERKLEAYSFSYGQSLLYNNIFPKHRERLGKKLSDLVQSIGKADLSGEALWCCCVTA